MSFQESAAVSGVVIRDMRPRRNTSLMWENVQFREEMLQARQKAEWGGGLIRNDVAMHHTTCFPPATIPAPHVQATAAADGVELPGQGRIKVSIQIANSERSNTGAEEIQVCCAAGLEADEQALSQGIAMRVPRALCLRAVGSGPSAQAAHVALPIPWEARRREEADGNGRNGVQGAFLLFHAQVHTVEPQDNRERAEARTHVEERPGRVRRSGIGAGEDADAPQAHVQREALQARVLCQVEKGSDLGWGACGVA
ncbi:hypothetical protein B0H15DRAFT_806821 [Mycena belliarum]|uniref:Uncharacterized protein n=1 Tax=Mycena belliarum TaxID=1033014 RepID=A0AAD6XIJ1_9AGAR|nr:hypothetical protein B0H15DRAFT_806821 [Mycena belliae]